MKKIIFFIFLTTAFSNLLSQKINYDFGKVSKAELEKSDYGEFNYSDAIYLYNSAVVNGNKITYHFRIKILNQQALNIDTWTLDINNNEELYQISAKTYTLINNKIVTSKLDKKQIENISKNDTISVFKFKIPDVMESSIIEIEYTILSEPIKKYPYIYIQKTYPVLKSRIKITNQFLDVDLKVKGDRKDFVEYRELESNSFFESPEFFYISLNIPGYEDIKNAIRLSIEIKETNNYYKIPLFDNNTSDTSKKEQIYYKIPLLNNLNSRTTFEYKDWDAMAKQYKDDLYFLLSGQKHVAISESFKFITEKNISETDKVLQVIEHIQNEYKQKNILELKYKGLLIKEVFRDKIGTPSELNILAGTVFLYSQIKVEPILVSTDKCFHFKAKKPIPYFFNHFIWKYTAENGQVYYLDVLNKKANLTIVPEYLIGDLGLNFYNGKASLQNFSKEVKTKKSQYISDISITENETIGNVNSTFSDYAAQELRKQISNTNLAEVEKKQFPSELINKIDWKYLKDFENILIADFQYESFDRQNNEISFNPFESLNNFMNPLNEKNETDIQFELLENETKKITITIPDNYYLKSIPENINISYLNDLTYRLYYNVEGNKIQILSKLKFKALHFDIKAYDFLYNIFIKKIERENENIILIKK